MLPHITSIATWLYDGSGAGLRMGVMLVVCGLVAYRSIYRPSLALPRRYLYIGTMTATMIAVDLIIASFAQLLPEFLSHRLDAMASWELISTVIPTFAGFCVGGGIRQLQAWRHRQRA